MTGDIMTQLAEQVLKGIKDRLAALSDASISMDSAREMMEKAVETIAPEHKLPLVSAAFRDCIIDRDVDLDTSRLVSLAQILGTSTFNGLHAYEILRLRGAQDVAPHIERHQVKVFTRLFGYEATSLLNDEVASMAKRKHLEEGFGL
jgi:hypothetical protein